MEEERKSGQKSNEEEKKNAMVLKESSADISYGQCKGNVH